MYRADYSLKSTILFSTLIIIANVQSSRSLIPYRQFNPSLGYFLLPFDLPADFSGPLYGLKDFMPLNSTVENDLDK